MKANTISAALLIGFGWQAAVSAEPINLQAALQPGESIRMDFADGSNQFVSMVRREGLVQSDGLLDGAKVVEVGWHDIDPPHGGDPMGYLEMTDANGDIAYLKWHVRGVFMGGEKKGPPVTHGVWELVSGTGAFASMRGLGTMQIAGANFSLQGDIAPRP